MKLLRTASHLALSSAILSGLAMAAQDTAFKAEEAYKIGGRSFYGPPRTVTISAGFNF